MLSNTVICNIQQLNCQIIIAVNAHEQGVVEYLFPLSKNNFSEQKHYIGKTLLKHFYQL